jgi:predicted transcriptional regulator of viral defense system
MTRISDALSAEIHRLKKPVITWFEVEQIVRRLYREGRYEGQSLMLRSSIPTSAAIHAARSSLTDRDATAIAYNEFLDPSKAELRENERVSMNPRTLVPDADFPGSVWRVTRVPDASPDELCCLVDPWCYVSHLSAMQQWSLSNRNPAALHLTRPKALLWRERAKAEVRARYPDLQPKEALPHPRERVTFPDTVRRRKISVFEPGYFGRFVAVPDSDARIATVGQTFWDSVHEPLLCGGMNHVLELWEQHAETHLEDIIDTLNDPELHTKKIAYVRAGYILAERFGIKDARIDAWAGFVERGGSRKLDPERPYAPVFSERWMLSLNV